MLDQSIVWCFAGEIKQEPGMYREGPTYQRRGSLQLWQFLVALLDDPSNSHFIAWTGRGMEFKLIEPEEVSSENLNLLRFLYKHYFAVWSVASSPFHISSVISTKHLFQE